MSDNVKGVRLPRGAATASKISLAVAAALAVTPPRLFALEAADTSALQEIVVTARKRQENLQDVPLSIDVFTNKDMQNLGIKGLDDYDGLALKRGRV